MGLLPGWDCWAIERRRICVLMAIIRVSLLCAASAQVSISAKGLLEKLQHLRTCQSKVFPGLATAITPTGAGKKKDINSVGHNIVCLKAGILVSQKSQALRIF